MIVILDYQHYGKPGKNDRGAFANGKYETELTWAYIEAAKQLAEAEGHEVVVLKDGWYSARHKRAAAIAEANPDQKCAYVACHVNAGGGDYSVCLHDYRSKGGKRLADSIRDTMTDSLGSVRRHLTKAATETNWTNGFNTIKGVFAGPGNLSGVCFEPVFIDTDEHQPFLTQDGLTLIGQTLAVGCIEWSDDE